MIIDDVDDVNDAFGGNDRLAIEKYSSFIEHFNGL